MKDLVEALTILLKYGNPYAPTHCEHDILTICGIRPCDVSDEDKARLKGLGFEREGDVEDDGFIEDPDDEEPMDDDEDFFYSFRFGSA